MQLTTYTANVMPNMRCNSLVRLLLGALAATEFVSPLQTEVALYRLNSSGLAHRQAASTANNVAVRSASRGLLWDVVSCLLVKGKPATVPMEDARCANHAYLPLPLLFAFLG